MQAGKAWPGALLKDEEMKAEMAVLRQQRQYHDGGVQRFRQEFEPTRHLGHVVEAQTPGNQRATARGIEKSINNNSICARFGSFAFCFLLMCITGGYAVSQVPARVGSTAAVLGMLIGFGMGGLCVAIDEMLKGFSLRAFSAATFGLFLGTVAAA